MNLYGFSIRLEILRVGQGAYWIYQSAVRVSASSLGIEGLQRIVSKNRQRKPSEGLARAIVKCY